MLNHFREAVGLRGRRRNPLNQSVSLNAIVDEDGEAERGELIADPSSAEPFEAAEAEIFTAQLHDALDKAIGKLPDIPARVIRDKWFEGKSTQQIADGLHIEPYSVRGYEYRGFVRLYNNVRLKAFHREILAYHHVGLSEYLHTWESSVERAVIRAAEVV